MINPLKKNTRIDAMVPWHGGFYKKLPMFEPIQIWAEHFSQFEHWPGLDDFQLLLSKQPPIHTINGAPLKIVEQAGKPETFQQHYAPRIYYSGEIQTRTENWHDFFQFLTWFIFPEAKAVINSIHIPLAKERIEYGGDIGRRSPVENTLSLFDEGGVVILSSDESLLQNIKDFQWKELFWNQREVLEQKLRCITFGHAMYEKGLKPYVGMTANAILLNVEQKVIGMSLTSQLQWIDQKLAAIFREGKHYQKPKDLNPFPILGMPGWVEENAVESYYDNQNYFRPGRKNKLEITA